MTNGQNGVLPCDFRHFAEKYAKFAYSTHFAFSIPSAQIGVSNVLAAERAGMECVLVAF